MTPFLKRLIFYFSEYNYKLKSIVNKHFDYLRLKCLTKNSPGAGAVALWWKDFLKRSFIYVILRLVDIS
jgi:hypothetical protein